MKTLEDLKAALTAAGDEEWDWGDLSSADGDSYAEIRTAGDDPTILFESCGPESQHSKNVDRAYLIALMKNALPALIECAETLEAIIQWCDKNNVMMGDISGGMLLGMSRAALAKLEKAK